MSFTTRLELTGQQYRALSEALRATIQFGDFSRMLKQRLDIDLQNISLAGNYEGVVFDVIDDANRKGLQYRKLRIRSARARRCLSSSTRTTSR